MAASKSASKKPVARSANKSVPQHRSEPAPSPSVARRKPVRRAKPQEPEAHQATLPTVQLKGDAVGAYPGDKYPSVDPTVIAAAFGRARTNLRWTAIAWDASLQQWEVPSSDPRRGTYRVRKRPGVKGKVPWWKALICNCMAENSGMYLACWHKAATVLLWRYRQACEVAHQNGEAEPSPEDI